MFRVEDTRLRESRKKCDACDQNPTSSNAGVPKEFSYANTMPQCSGLSASSATDEEKITNASHHSNRCFSFAVIQNFPHKVTDPG